MAKVAKCSERSISNIRKNLRSFRRARSALVSVLCDHLAERPSLYVEEMCQIS